MEEEMIATIVDPVPGTDYHEEYDRTGKLLSRTPMVHSPADVARIAAVKTVAETLTTADASLTTLKLARTVKALARMRN